MANSSATGRSKNKPEKKIGPLPGGLGVAIWLNTVQTDDGPRKVRSIALSPRRYRDSKTGEWKDSPSYQVGDIPALIFALQQAQEHIFMHPLPNDSQGATDDGPN